jgi:hypothetical protein
MGLTASGIAMGRLHIASGADDDIKLVLMDEAEMLLDGVQKMKVDTHAKAYIYIYIYRSTRVPSGYVPN